MAPMCSEKCIQDRLGAVNSIGRRRRPTSHGHSLCCCYHQHCAFVRRCCRMASPPFSAFLMTNSCSLPSIIYTDTVDSCNRHHSHSVLSNMADSIPRGPVAVNLTFYQPPPDNSVPFNYVHEPPTGQSPRNYGDAIHTVQLTDIRSHEEEYTLDKDAFAALQSVPSETTYATFDSDAAVRDIYYPEVEKLLLDHLPGAHKIVIFDHTIRRESPNADRQPVNRAHVDQTAKAAADRVRLHVPNAEEAERLLQGRYRIVNVWRPINGAVVSSPLAFASAQSVHQDDLVPVEHRYPDRTGETMGVKFNAGQKWLYWSGMDNGERLLLKCSDTERRPGIGLRVPHSAFLDPRTPQGAKGRESIEVRALVFG